jgi:hypothetical protein
VHTTITQDATAKLMNLFFYVFVPRIVCAKPGDRLGGAGLSGPVLADAAVALSKLPELDTLEYVGLPRAVVYLLVHERLSTLPRPPKSLSYARVLWTACRVSGLLAKQRPGVSLISSRPPSRWSCCGE